MTHTVNDTDTQNVLELLAMTMFADKRVLSEEIKVFVASVQTFQTENILPSTLSEAEIIHWYEDHKTRLIDIAKHSAFEDWINQKIDDLAAFPDKHRLLQAMDDIARADGNVHFSEQALVILATRKWADMLVAFYKGNPCRKAVEDIRRTVTVPA